MQDIWRIVGSYSYYPIVSTTFPTTCLTTIYQYANY